MPVWKYKCELSVHRGKRDNKNKSEEQGLVKAIDIVIYFVVAFIVAQSKRR